MIRVNFADKASRDAFADRFKLSSKVGDVQLDIGWNLLQFAKKDDKALDYEEVAVLTSGPSAATEKDFIVKGDINKFRAHANVKQDLGKGFYLVSTSTGLALSDHVDSIEHTSGAVKFMGNASNISSVNPDTTTLNPTSAEGQWARIRCASRYRPLLGTYSTYEMNYRSKPELYVIDSGIDFNNPEFDYPELEKVNFYTVFDGDFTDYRGHGTAVSSMAVGKNLGIANHCKLLSVKIANQGEEASIFQLGQALDAIKAAAVADPTVTRIVNCSWGVARSEYLDAKFEELIALGITVVCAAGNSGVSVEDVTPAGIDNVMTVASMDKFDIPSGFNNISPTDTGVVTGHGLSLDIFAPGENVMVAYLNNSYRVMSGTSFAAPLVAGIAAEIAALNAGVVGFATMKATILSTATPNALLFEDTTFTEAQNKIAYIFTSDPNANYKLNNMSMYLGVHNEDQPIVADLNSSIDCGALGKVIAAVPVFSIEWLDPAAEAQYKNFVSVNPETGLVTITKPTVALASDTKLKMVEFRGVATVGTVKVTSPNIFFFHTNPLHAETQQSDITLALTNTNSISFFGSWGVILK